MDCSLPGYSVHVIFQARILDWVAISFFWGSSQSRNWTHTSCVGRQVLYHYHHPLSGKSCCVGKRQTGEQLYQRSSRIGVKVLGSTTDFPTWGFGKKKDWESPMDLTLKASGIWLQNFHRAGETETLREHKQNLVYTRTQEKGAVSPQETDPDYPVSVQESLAETWVNCGLSQCQGHWPHLGATRETPLVAQLVKKPPAMHETWIQSLIGKIPWRRQSLPTPVFWPGEFHGLYSPWGCKESDTAEWLSPFFNYLKVHLKM